MLATEGKESKSPLKSPHLEITFPDGSVEETQQTLVWSLGQEDLLEKEMPTHSSILVWEIPWTEECAGLQSMGLQRVGHDWETNYTAQS